MATIYGSTSSIEWSFKLEVEESSFSNKDNNSSVVVGVYIGRTRTTSWLAGNYNLYITCDGQYREYSGNVPYKTYVNAGDYYKLTDFTFTIRHEDDGSKKIKIESEMRSSAFNPNSCSADGEVELTKIARQSTIDNIVSGTSDSQIVIDTSSIINVKYTKNVDSYYQKLEIYEYMGDNTEEHLIKTITESDGLTSDHDIQFTQAEVNNLYNLTKNQNINELNGKVWVGLLLFKLYTYEDNTMQTQIGEISSRSRTAVLENAYPTITAKLIDSFADTRDLTQDENVLIRYESTAKITPKATALKGADIKSITINGVLLEDKEYIEFVKSSAIEYNVIVTDTRDLSTTFKLQSTDENADNFFKLIPYIRLTLNVGTLKRNTPTDDKMYLEYSGNYFNSNFSVNKPNSLQVEFRYKVKGANDNTFSDWIQLTPIISENTYTETYISEAVLDYKKIYTIEITAKDELNIYNKTNLALAKGIPIVNWDDDMFNVNGRLTVNNQDVTSADTLPIGAIVEYDGNIVPEGYEEVEDENKYSTEEQIVGTWIDDKPIYRKVITNTTTLTASGSYKKVSVPHSITGIGDVVHCYGSAYFNDYNAQKTFPSSITLDGLPYSIGVIDITSSNVNIQFGHSLTGTVESKIVLEYTKATD